MLKEKMVGIPLDMVAKDIVSSDAELPALNDMEEDYSPSTVVQTYIAMGTLFKAARENGVNGVKHFIKMV